MLLNWLPPVSSESSIEELVKLFLQLNGYEIHSNPGEAYQFLLDVAAGKIPAADVNKWVTTNLTEFKEG
jgi:prophage maintenance system killer protein